MVRGPGRDCFGVRMRNSSYSILPPAGRRVKAKIIEGGLKLSGLAAAAGISSSSLSDHLAGRRRKPETQLAIYLAYVELSGMRPSFAEFWGELFNRKVG